ncbi:cytochrome P450 4c3-like isoform X1 [Argiope bruennichi]|uniref:cytochrome P450 4c3-like isoform X1 n=1 Tax=Argiope bruennichi TaxID=94029 RepID=UPI002494D9D9|nr:cytochrome P450 4c3-like isoform X1 [Argiope bruennichi]
MFAWITELDTERVPLAARLRNLWPVLVPLCITFVLTLVQWLWWKYNVWNLSSLPTSKCKYHVIMTTTILASVFKNKVADANVLFFQILRGMCSITQQMNQGIFYFWTGLRPVVFCFSPEFFEAILKNPNNVRKSFDYTFLSLWLKEGLVTSEGPKWKQRRRALTTAFHFRILEDFVSVFDDQSKYMVEKLKNVTEKNRVIDIVPYITRCTLDIICETAMGLRINAQDNEDSFYVRAMHRVAEGFIGRLLRPWLWSDLIYFRTKRGQEFKANAAKMDEFTRKVIIERKSELLARLKNNEDTLNRNPEKKKAFMDLLLDMHLSDPKSFTERDIQEEVDSFMFAGHDTTAVGTSWVLYLLGLHPEVQDKILEELDRECGDDPDKPFQEDCLKRLKYLECVIKEAQRIYTPAPFIGRQLQEDVEVDGFKIPKGTTCMLVIYMLHRHPESFPDPEIFNPDRFLPENCLDRHPFAYCPFSAGSRSCIGQKFAMLEEKVMIANVLRNFRVRSVDQRDKLHLSAEMVLRSRNGIRLELTPRK